MRKSPRTRRLRTDRKALDSLRRDSTILDFDAHGDPTERYDVRFFGKGFYRPQGSNAVQVRELHRVRIELGASYPRMMPELTWVSPIFHPNISGSGVVCLGGYGTHWVPSLNLDELCEMLWDMIRYANFDVDSPYNREAALWAKSQAMYNLPIDRRSIRDRLAESPQQDPSTSRCSTWPSERSSDATAQPEVVIIDDDDIIDAEIVESEDQDIVFLD